MKKKLVIGLASATLVLGSVTSFAFANANPNIETKAYGDSDETWYVDGEFNSWSKNDSIYHLSVPLSFLRHCPLSRYGYCHPPP